MYKLVILIVATLLMSCSSLEQKGVSSPGYQYGRQLDEASFKRQFIERN